MTNAAYPLVGLMMVLYALPEYTTVGADLITHSMIMLLTFAVVIFHED